jgi:hypothetical protein
MSELLIITNAVLQMAWLLHRIMIRSHPASKKMILKVMRHYLGFQRYAMAFC